MKLFLGKKKLSNIIDTIRYKIFLTIGGVYVKNMI
jgi:hypothetical protein